MAQYYYHGDDGDDWCMIGYFSVTAVLFIVLLIYSCKYHKNAVMTIYWQLVDRPRSTEI